MAQGTGRGRPKPLSEPGSNPKPPRPFRSLPPGLRQGGRTPVGTRSGKTLIGDRLLVPMAGVTTCAIVADREEGRFDRLASLDRRAASRAARTAGNNSPISTAMIAITTRSSISVKPRCWVTRITMKTPGSVGGKPHLAAIRHRARTLETQDEFFRSPLRRVVAARCGIHSPEDLASGIPEGRRPRRGKRLRGCSRRRRVPVRDGPAPRRWSRSRGSGAGRGDGATRR